jgi:hypothetical protein
MTSPTIQSTPKSSSTAKGALEQFLLRPLQEMLSEFSDSLERLYNQTPNPLRCCIQVVYRPVLEPLPTVCTWLQLFRTAKSAVPGFSIHGR